MRPDRIDALGESDLTLGGLRLWVHGREFEDASDYWDGNWLRVSMRCEYPGAQVSLDGPVLHLGDLRSFLSQVEELHATFHGSAQLACIEPNLQVGLVIDGKGRVRVTIDITPNHLQQNHRFVDELDQTHLRPVMAACRTILSRYPIRGDAPH